VNRIVNKDMVVYQRPVKKQGLRWYVVKKAKHAEDKGVVIDCIEASSIDIAFGWAMEKWAHMIARSHDSGPKGEGTYCLFVLPIEEANNGVPPGDPEVLFDGKTRTVHAPTREEIEKYGFATDAASGN
jgi:hypothetical protein